MNTATIGCVGGLGFFLLLFGLIAFLRYLKYRETLVLAEKGLIHPEAVSRRSGIDALRAGIIFTALGLALSLGLYPLGLSGNVKNYPLGLGPWMLAGFVPIFIGLALILIHVLTRKEESREVSAEKAPEKGEM